MKRCLYLYFTIVGYCSALPTAIPQFPPFFGGGSNNTNPGGNNNGSSNTNAGFFQGLSGLLNNFMSSIWGFLPIPGRTNPSSQSPTIPDSVLANTPPGMVPVAIPLGPVTNGAGGSPTLMPQQNGGSFDANAILHFLQQQQQQLQQQQQPQPPPSAAPYPQFPQGLPQNLQVLGQPSNSITIPGPGGTYQVISQTPTQNAGGYQILSSQSQPQTPTFQVVGSQQPNGQQVTYQVVSSPQPQTMQQTLPQQTILLPPPRKR